ncbi:putative glycosyltransferase EpsF [Pelotomaculum schinkii]|uniref:Putative glycosyltransferase EpsF n=1 Tax=Pelotomaculum schinkii TaxID=78350 RepID=A0A4Y7RGT0_9FIRM|nr:glycosyltransferase [Pelotomaculum schinkii]TEB08218.1 putative glycosyltransferase EpsF [Pelotomaculum schinkii]
MKVLQINSVCGVGSTGRIVTDIHSILKSNNIESYIAYGRETSVVGDHIIKIGTKPDYFIHGGLTRIFDTHALWGSARATREFIKKVKEIDPDVIHLHNLHGYYINIKILFDYLKESGKPVVWTLHDCWSFTGHCAYFSYVQCDKWKWGCNDCPQKRGYPGSLIFDRSKQNFDSKRELFTSLSNMTIVTPSNWLANLIQESYLNKYPVKVIPNGIDLNVFKPTESDFRKTNCLQDKFIILGVANGWGKRKGYQYFLELADILDDSFRIVLVGLTKKQKERLPKNIVGITKIIKVKELAKIYSAADVFINPTLEDNFPTTNLESLACGTPLITFNTGGGIESIDECCGIVVDKREVTSLFDAIKQINYNYSTNFCLERAKLFDRSKMLSRYQDIYDDCYRKSNH